MALAMKWEGGDVHGRTFWLDGVWAGLIAGAVFMMLQMLLVWAVNGQSPWGPPRMIAAMILGKDVLPPPAGFDPGVMMAAMVVHFMFSVAYGLLGAWLVHRVDLGVALLIGAVYGLAIYLVNFHALVPGVFPWFVMARSGITTLNHVVLGIVLTGAYIGLRNRHGAH